MNSNQFVGIWNLISFEYRGSDGKTFKPFGVNTSGILTYDEAGNVTVQLMGSVRKGFASDDLGKATAEETLAAMQSYIAYFGRYDVDEKSGKVTHHVSGSVFPNWTGGDQVRFFKFSKDRLSLSTPPMPVGGALVIGLLEWERIG